MKMPKSERTKVADTLIVSGNYKYWDRVTVKPAGGRTDKLIVILETENDEGSRILPVPAIVKRVKSELDKSARTFGDHTYNVHLAKLKSSSDALELILRAEVVACTD